MDHDEKGKCSGTSQQDPFLDAVECNDMETAQKMLKNRKSLARNYGRSSASFAQAIRDNNFDMLKMLLESDLNMGCALLHAIEQSSCTAVIMICKHLQPSKLAMKTTLNAFADDDEFPHYTTPLLFSSCRNQRDIVKMLIEFGAELPCVDAMVSRAGPEHYDGALARLHYYTAISNESYLLATPDPLESAFEAGRKIKAFEKVQLPSLRKHYRDMKTNLDIFASKLLMKIESTEDIRSILLNGRSAKSGSKAEKRRKVRDTGESQSRYDELANTLPQRVQDAIELDYKQFLVSTNCQQYILEQWYRGRKDWQNLSPLAFSIWTLLVVICKPVLCLLYILIPMNWVQVNIKAPYVRFLLHFTSRFLFVLLLLESTLSAIKIEHDLVDDYQGLTRIKKYLEYKASPPDYLTIATYVMITGMTWREIKELWLLGPRMYFTEWFNWVDLCQLTCYWMSIILNIVSFATLYSIKSTLNSTSVNGNASDADVIYQNIHTNYSNSGHLKLNWHSYDTLITSEAAFAIGTVLTFLALLHDAIILSFVGPLLVSFVGMIKDIAKFLLIFVFVWISFGIGLTQLYRTFEELEAATCLGDDCQPPVFAYLDTTLKTLFWSLFDLTDLDNLQSPHERALLTETVGIILYATYMLIVVIVMLNALIAMMNNTYTRVEENSEVEWKLHRTKLMAKYMTNVPTLPPPFNLVPTVKTILWLVSCRCCWTYTHKNKSDDSDVAQAQRDKYQDLISLLTDRYIDELDRNNQRDQDKNQIMELTLTTLKEAIDLIRNELKEARAETATALSQLKERYEPATTSTESHESGKRKFRFGKL